MKLKNAPERRRQRQIRALARLRKSEKTALNRRIIAVLEARTGGGHLRDVRTKKDRRLHGRRRKTTS
jgi:hypothetical protein